ncbi:hypothetical protein predicted by Glimmer/Critica [Lactiplantibacillus plantarum]|nr:hypothetical protein predicted by Glimmer/Critica [Lactiplantibacillus plantarum]
MDGQGDINQLDRFFVASALSHVTAGCDFEK